MINFEKITVTFEKTAKCDACNGLFEHPATMFFTKQLEKMFCAECFETLEQNPKLLLELPLRKELFKQEKLYIQEKSSLGQCVLMPVFMNDEKEETAKVLINLLSQRIEKIDYLKSILAKI